MSEHVDLIWQNGAISMSHTVRKPGRDLQFAFKKKV